jgi:hypothetical protein
MREVFFLNKWEKGGRKKERKETWIRKGKKKRRISTDLDFDFTTFSCLVTNGSVSPFLNEIS